MPFDYFDTHTLLAAVEQIAPTSNFLRDRYFPTSDGDIFTTNKVLVEYRDGSRMAAPFVVPRKGGVLLERDGYSVSEYEPPTIAPKRMLTVDTLKRKGFGEAIMRNLTPAQREQMILVKDMDELGESISIREEAMAAEVMQTNGCVMKHIADNKTVGDTMEIRYYSESQNPAKYTPTGNWETSYDGILKDLGVMVRTLTSRGLPATELVVGADVADAILNNTAIQKLLDIRNFDLGRVNPALLPDGASRIAVLNVKGRIIDVICYEEQYVDYEDGKTKSFIDPKSVVLTAPAAGRTAYGAVTQLEQADNEFHTYGGKRVPKFVSNADRNTREIIVTARPILMPKAKNAFVTAKVLA